jgi:hypothetical protein
MNDPNRKCPGPVSRRSFLQTGALGLGGLSLADVMRMRANAGGIGADPDTSVIFIWMPGGPPHMEMYDMKPDAPVDYRGEFKPIKTNVPGIDVCELMPLHAKVADKFTLVRSISHDFADHGGGHKRFMTGRVPATPVDTVNDAPAVGSIVAKCREHINRGVPNYISGADAGRDGVDVFAMGAAYLGPSYVPFSLPGDPSNPSFQVRNLELSSAMEGRLEDRATLLTGLDKLRRDADRTGAMAAMDTFNQKAFDLLTNEAARKAFDLTQEPEKLRDRYGRHPWGQRALMARRLVEAGSSFVTMLMENPVKPGEEYPFGVLYNWDSHAVNGHLFNDARFRLPIYDQAVTALIEDIYNRGLDKKVMVIVTGEFGRTPRVSTQIGTQTKVMQPGRDHWPSAMSLLCFGGGMQTGQIVGSTTAKGETPRDRPLTPNDLWASVYHHLGIDPRQTFPDRSGRPMHILPFGDAIPELLPSRSA